MTVTNALLNGAPILVTDVSMDVGSPATEHSAGILFLDRPAVLVLKGTGLACESMVGACCGEDSELNTVTFSATVQKNSEDAIGFDVTVASISGFDYVRAESGVGEATLRLLVRKMDLTVGEAEIPFEYDARAD